MRLADVMSRQPTVVEDTTPAAYCANLMAGMGVRHLPIVDADGCLTGLLSDHELRHHRTWADEGYEGATARHLQRAAEVVTGPGTTVTNALDLLARSAQDAVVVARDDRVPVGIFTEQDAMQLAARVLPPEPLAKSDAPLPVLDGTTPALDARSWLAKERLLHALVIRDSLLVGVLSFRDVAVVDDLADHLTAADVASRPVVTRHVLGAKAIADVFARRRIGCLPRVDEDWHPVDVTTRRELMRALANALA